MKLALALFLGRPIPRAEFEGSPSERLIYERACRLWRAAGLHVREHTLIKPTLGATVSRCGLHRKACMTIPLFLVLLFLGVFAVLLVSIHRHRCAVCTDRATQISFNDIDVAGDVPYVDPRLSELAKHNASLPEHRN
jgi:hypothetical protein